MFEFEENLSVNAKIKVIGVGGGGGNAIKTMMKEQIVGVDFIAINTDVQSLRDNDAMVKIQIGSKLTRGLGSGSNPQVGRDAAMEDATLISEALSGSDMVFITAGMGGGTGTGAVPVIAKVARDMGILTVGVVTKPFSFEGKKRMRQAETGIAALQETADTIICIPNDNMLNIAGKDTPITDCFKMIDYVLLQAVRGISDLITTPGLINLDFSDIRTIMKDSGYALMATGVARGENRAIEAAKAAIRSPILEGVSITGATGVLLNISGSSNMTLFEVNEASKLIQQECHEDANIIFGTVVDENRGDDLRITVIATGFGKELKNIKRDIRREADAWAPKPAVATVKNDPVPAYTIDTPMQNVAAPQLSLREVFESSVQNGSEEEDYAGDSEDINVEENEIDADPVKPAWAENQEVNGIADRLMENTRRTRNETLFVSQNSSATVWGSSPSSRSETVMAGVPAPASGSGAATGDVSAPASGGLAVPPRVTRRRTENLQEKADLKKMFSDMGLDDDADEYDIPAFMRRRAD